MAKLDKDLDLTNGDDPEVRQRWLQLAILQKYDAVNDKINWVVSNVGRQKYLLPIYESAIYMKRVDEAKKWLEDNKKKYHPSTNAAIIKLFEKQPE